MDGYTVGIALRDKDNFGDRGLSGRPLPPAEDELNASPSDCPARGVFLRIPPFPGARTRFFNGLGPACGSGDVASLLSELKVGGSYWAAQPKLPKRYVLVTQTAAIVAAAATAGADPLVLWTGDADESEQVTLVIRGECDPWHMLAGASMLIASAEDELCLIAALSSVPTQIFDENAGTLVPHAADARRAVGEMIHSTYQNPFSGDPMSAAETIKLCGFWRQLIDRNRDIGGGVGFAFWKQDHIAPLLWDGSTSFSFLRDARDIPNGKSAAVWHAKASLEQMEALDRAGSPVVEVEDGFLRSQGLGADCVPPLSITVDRLGAYFDPAQPSELELLLQNGEFDQELLDRARRVRRMIVEARLGKYERGDNIAIERPAGARRHILVPGQVEDDRAVQSGGCGLVSNLDLLSRVRAQAPDAYVLYKPHPDVLAGHRRGAISERACLQQADKIVTGVPISSVIEMVDEVHVNTSLAGFEALMRDRAVTTYGVPFYAGWGLTRDLGPVPKRRSRRRKLDELVAAALLLYPRYLDPLSALPCPPEVVVERLSEGTNRRGPLVFVRRLQGKLMRRFRSAAQ